MTYNPAIPAANDLISQSQAQIQTNFSQLDLIFDVDHVTFNNSTAGDRGKHRHSTYVEQSVNPTTAVNEVALFAKDNGGIETLYFRKESNGTTIQMTGQDPVGSAPGSTFLPGGLVMKFGQASVSDSNPSNIVTFITPFPTACLTVTISIVAASVPSGTVIVKDGSLAANQFLVRSTAGATSIFYCAIGN